nr:reverse transcriptase domain-containing protein [Tanacetum cinerariifolium]
MPPKRSSTSEASTMSQAAIRKLVADSIAVALKTQTTTMAEADNSIREILELLDSSASLREWDRYFLEATVLKRIKMHLLLYYPRTEIKKMEDEFYNLSVKGNDLKTYVRRFQKLAVLCPSMVPNNEKLMEVFIDGLPTSIEGNITALKPQTLEEAINIAQRRIVMQVTLHYEAIVMQVMLHDKRIVMQVTLHYEAIVMQVTLYDKRIVVITIVVVPAATITAAPVKVAAASTRQRRGVVIRDPEEESSAKTLAEIKSKDKGKGIMDIDWDVAIDHVKQKAKEDPFVQRYQVMKKRPQTEAQARRNMIMYLKNVTGFKLDYFKGMCYDDIRLIFKAKFNTNIKFLLKSMEQIEEEENRAIKSINETLAQKAAKRRKINEDVKDLKQHLEIVPDEDDNIYTEATPLARKVPVVDYQIIQLNNKPRYKIIRADGTHQLYVSVITLLKKFDREDLESLWSIVKERFSTSKPNNYSDDYLLTTLRAMFGRRDEQDQVWKSQRSIHGQAMVKS